MDLKAEMTNLAARYWREQDLKNTGTYFIKCHNFVKIGYGSDCRQRLIECQVGNPYKLQLTLVLPSNFEYSLHAKLRDLHHQGDWHHIAGRLQDFLEKNSILPPNEWGA
ncbi:MAG TPA: hypothetical protein VH187_05400 [Scandinavium sp.]|uniref:hypothetical protein n=1 Tax=Scandinavium sp. TaxID=2830653 RepID=UPI002E356AAE|nr:hypothetical protein [Scandinavium sp.]HEX4500596.1 hypothetical protein [Scandinavium sp.]